MSPNVLQTSTMTAYNRDECLELESRMSVVDKTFYEVNLQQHLANNTMCLTNVTHGGEETCFVSIYHGDSYILLKRI